ncbi:MAG TPA: DUF2891 family protein [Acidimicrobiales bacterium]|nr:DUF2891 family protein [Acidimicrobiales bacterium]
MPAVPLDEQGRVELATAVVGAVNREYPHRLIQELNSDADVVPPRVLNPSFFGSYDWHSAVHSHWTLVRCLGAGLPTEVSNPAVAVLDEHLAEAPLNGELSFYSGPGGRVAERPYGWAWLVMLHAECGRLAASSPDGALAEAGRRWGAALEPLSSLLRDRLVEYFASGLAFPIRDGTHANTAFSLQLLHQAAAAAGDNELSSAVSAVGRHCFSKDAPLPWRGPPSGSDFLDPPLVEAALMADILDGGRFRSWMAQVCPAGVTPDWGPTSFVPDGADPGKVHLEGLLVSRAWCLDRLGRALGPGTPLAAAALSGRDAHLEAVAKIDPSDGFGRAHWLPTYLVYLEGWLTGSL